MAEPPEPVKSYIAARIYKLKKYVLEESFQDSRPGAH
jgi:hypothetical protein